MAIITIAGISYHEWFRFVIKKLALIYLLGTVALSIAIYSGLG
jgi:uncharacterized ion transporter superfamily protein YfcC